MDSLPDSRMIRTSSKLTDELVTLDSPRRHSRMFSKSMYNTTQQFRKKLSQSKNLILADASSLWQQSATTYVIALNYSIDQRKEPQLRIQPGIKIFVTRTRREEKQANT